MRKDASSLRKAAKQNDIALFIAMMIGQFFLLFPEGLTHTEAIRFARPVQTAIMVIALFVVLAMYVKNRFILANIAFFIVLALATLRRSNQFAPFLLYASRSIGIVVLYYYVSRRNYILFWKYATIFFAVVALANTVLTITRPNGIVSTISARGSTVRYYLLGNKNQVMPFYIFGAAISMIYHQMIDSQKLRSWAIYIQGWICSYYYRSSTSLIMLFVFGALVILLANNKHMSKRKRGLAFMAVLVVFLMNYGLLVLDIQNYFAGVIEGVLNKDVTLSTRVDIWREGIRMIQQSFLFGYGTSNRRYINVGTSALDSHNFVLQIFLMGGVLLFISLIVIYAFAFKNWSKSKQQFKIIALILLIAFAVGSASEVYVLTYAFIVPVLMYIIGDYEKSVRPRIHTRRSGAQAEAVNPVRMNV